MVNWDAGRCFEEIEHAILKGLTNGMDMPELGSLGSLGSFSFEKISQRAADSQSTIFDRSEFDLQQTQTPPVLPHPMCPSMRSTSKTGLMQRS